MILKALRNGIGFVIPAAAHAAMQAAAVPNYSMTPRRLGASLSVLIALVAVVMGWRALGRAANARRGALAALVLGPLSLVGGALVVVTAQGGLGTGNGLAGGVVAIMVGVIGMTLGGVALRRSRTTG
jgi:hypothetical protein